MTAQKTFNNKGFTLIELLVVIGILAVLLAITLIAINPARQFAQANDTKRRSDVNAILNAVHQYAVEWNGQLPAAITTSDQAISNGAADLCDDLVPEYVAALPSDPQAANGGVNIEEGDCAAYDTEYTILQTAAPNNRVTVTAPNAETVSLIEVTR